MLTEAQWDQKPFVILRYIHQLMQYRLCPIDEKKRLGMEFNIHRDLQISNSNSNFFCLIVAV